MRADRWTIPALAATVGTVAHALSLTERVFEHDLLSMTLFLLGPALLVGSGVVGRWRGVPPAFAAPLTLVLLFPERDSGPPIPPGACDPFCADPVAGLGWAVGLGCAGAALALLGWFAGAILRGARAALLADG